MATVLTRREKVSTLFFWGLVIMFVLMSVINFAGNEKKGDACSPSEESTAQNVTLEDRIAEVKSELKNDPENVSLLVTLGDLYIGAKRYDSALEIFKKLEKLSPSNFHVLSDLGVIYQSMGQFKLAVEKLEKASAISPNSVNTLLHLAAIYRYRLNDNQKAFEILSKLEKMPLSPRIRNMVQKEMSTLKKPTNSPR